MAVLTSPHQRPDAGHPLQRLEQVRRAMCDRGLDALLAYSQKRGHVAYLSGYRPNYHTNSAFLVLPRTDDPVLLIKFGFDLPRARSMSWVNDIRTLDSEAPETLEAGCLRILRDLRLDHARIGYAAGDEAVDEWSVGLLRAFREGLPEAHWEPASGLLNRMRLEKSPEEVRLLRRATEIAESAAAAIGASLVPGAEDYEVWAAASAAALRAGAERCDLIISLAPGELALPPAHRRFRPGAVVTCELTVAFEGYWTQICRTFCTGEPAAPQTRIFAACKAAYEAAVQEARPGAPVAAAAAAAVGALESHGFGGCLKYGLGHGVGLDLPEPYEVELHARDSFQANMVTVIHVGAWSHDAAAAAFLGGPVVVGGTGTEPLDRPQRNIIYA